MQMSKKRVIINWMMLVSLIAVVISGILLHPMPGMWLGIVHGVSGMILTISIIIHCFQHRGKK